MENTGVYASIAARCGKNGICIWGDGDALNPLYNNIQSACGELNVRKNCTDADAYIFAATENADMAAFLQVSEGKPRAVISAYAEGNAPDCPVLGFDINEPREGDISALLSALLSQFPVLRVDVKIPEWAQVLPQDNSAISELLTCVTSACAAVNRQSDIAQFKDLFTGAKYWQEGASVTIDDATGTVTVVAAAKEGIYFTMLSEMAEDEITGEYSLMRFVRSAAEAKRGYLKVKDALECAKVNGYGIVQPSDGDITYENPSVVRQGGSVGIKLKAAAPSYHIIRVDVAGEVNPIMGSAAQSENMVQCMMQGFEKNAEEMWNTNLFGKTLKSMVQEGLAAKVDCMQEETRLKLKKAINRMVNEGKGGAIVIIL